MRLVFPIITALLLPFYGWAGELENLASNLQSTYQKTSSWHADFVQSTFVELLNKKISKSGKIFVKKPGKLRIEYKGSHEKHYISDGKTLWVYVLGDTQIEVYQKISKMLAQEALTFLKGMGNVEKEFHVKLVPYADIKETMIQDKSLKPLELIPRNYSSPILKIIIGMDRETYVIKEATLFNDSGNKTHYTFSNIKLNAELEDSLFQFKKPEGVREIKL